MKIGMLTFFYGANYGAQAHSFALCRTLTDMGHNCEFISYYPCSRRKLWFSNFIHTTFRKYLLIHPIRSFRNLRKMRLFKEFHSSYNVSKRVKSGSEIDALGYDLIILGSDEIFTIGHNLHSNVNFGVGIEKTPKITYAPSAGQTDVRHVLSDDVVESLKSMISISARDKNTAELLQNNCGREIPVVLDPTLLYDFSRVANPFQEDSYILLYAFRLLDEYKERIREYATEKGLSVISVGRYRPWADKSYDLPSISQWLGTFKNASLVVTDSFHGTIFAIKDRREFINTGFVKNTSKVNCLLEDLSILRPGYDNNVSIEQHIERFPIDYDEVHEVIEKKKTESINYLIGALEESLHDKTTV